MLYIDICLATLVVKLDAVGDYDLGALLYRVLLTFLVLDVNLELVTAGFDEILLKEADLLLVLLWRQELVEGLDELVVGTVQPLAGSSSQNGL